jgi:hypothetical protein
MVSSTGIPASDYTQTAQIPSLLTSSLRTVFDDFGETIVSITANGSVETTNGTIAEELRKYGVTREQRTHHGIELDFQQITTDGEPSNPLTSDARQRIIGEIETVLDSNKISVEPDLTVTAMTLRVTDERLQEVTPAQTPEFDLTFVADPAEAPVRERTQRQNAGRGLYGELGFNITNLNLRSVVETATKYQEQTDGQYLSWGGPEDIRPKAPAQLAIRINQHILPDAYGMLKPYEVTDDQVLELREGEIDGETRSAVANRTDSPDGEDS